MPIFFYDANCSFCSWAATHLKNLTVGLDVQPAAQNSGSIPRSVTDHISSYAVYLPNGQDSGDAEYHLGHRAIGAALQAQGRNSILCASGTVLLNRVLSPLFAGIYRLVANNRDRIGPAMGLNACTIPGQDGPSESTDSSAGSHTDANTIGATMNRPVLGE